MSLRVVTKGSVIKEVNYGTQSIDEWEALLCSSKESIRIKGKEDAMSRFYNPTRVIREALTNRGLGLL